MRVGWQMVRARAQYRTRNVDAFSKRTVIVSCQYLALLLRPGCYAIPVLGLSKNASTLRVL